MHPTSPFSSRSHLSPQDCEILYEVCGWINAKATIPVWAKMTPNITGGRLMVGWVGMWGMVRVITVHVSWYAGADRHARECRRAELQAGVRGGRPYSSLLLPCPLACSADIAQPAHTALAAGCEGITAINSEPLWEGAAGQGMQLHLPGVRRVGD